MPPRDADRPVAPAIAGAIVRLPADSPWPLRGVAGSRAIEAAAQSTAPQPPLMERAGQAVARLGLAVAPHARRVWVACGPGNNGGDGLVAARHLAAAGKDVVCTLEGDPARLPPDAARAWQALQGSAARIVSVAPELDPGDLAIDGLLGLGARRAPEGRLAERIGQLNSGRATRLAIDLPSGLDADTGRRLGPSVVEADHTLTLLTAKPGLFTAHGRDAAGCVWFDALGMSPPPTAEAWLSPGCPATAQPRHHASHKGSFGDVLVVGGAAGLRGAAVLAAGSAHGAGAGRVYLALLEPSMHPAPVDLPIRPELMLRTDPEAEAPAAWSKAVVACGCGGGDRVHRLLGHWLRHAMALVLDADALNAIATDAALQRALARRRALGRPTVLTPHPLEAARLLGTSTDAVQADRLAAARAIAERFGSIVVLKGSGSIVAAPGEPPWINASGSAALASAGTGDVLAGWIAGRWAAAIGMPTARAADPPRDPGASAQMLALGVTREAVLLHGWIGAAGGSGPMRALDLLEAMHAHCSAVRPVGGARS
jgi:hydroxyethylthiazole kinase-like uncharacterized protein yjeF